MSEERKELGLKMEEAARKRPIIEGEDWGGIVHEIGENFDINPRINDHAIENLGSMVWSTIERIFKGVDTETYKTHDALLHLEQTAEKEFGKTLETLIGEAFVDVVAEAKREILIEETNFHPEIEKEYNEEEYYEYQTEDIEP